MVSDSDFPLLFLRSWTLIKSGISYNISGKKKLKFSQLTKDDEVKSLIPISKQKNLFLEIQKRAVGENYLTADDYDAVVHLLGLNAGKVEFDLPMPH